MTDKEKKKEKEKEKEKEKAEITLYKPRETKLVTETG
tara:strand:- start:6841 stop:6951 length:111 start_codon:yes stop_codon:yes gene_type:complete